MQAKRDEAGLTKWFKRRRAFYSYMKRNSLYYIAGISFMRGIEPLTSNVSVIDLLYKHIFVGNMILITIAAALIALGYLMNAREK